MLVNELFISFTWDSSRMQTNIPSSSMKIKLRRNITGKKLTIGIIAMKSSLKNNIPWFLLSGTPSTAKNLFWGDWCKVEQGSGAKFVIGEVLTASLVKNIISYLEKKLLCKYDGFYLKDYLIKRPSFCLPVWLFPVTVYDFFQSFVGKLSGSRRLNVKSNGPS